MLEAHLSAARKQYSITDASRDLEALASRARAGESFTLTSEGSPVAELTPPRRGRVGCMRGTLRVVGDDTATTADEWPDLR